MTEAPLSAAIARVTLAPMTKDSKDRLEDRERTRTAREAESLLRNPRLSTIPVRLCANTVTPQHTFTLLTGRSTTDSRIGVSRSDGAYS